MFWLGVILGMVLDIGIYSLLAINKVEVPSPDPIDIPPHESNPADAEIAYLESLYGIDDSKNRRVK